MWSSYNVYNLATSGTLILLLYILVEILLLDYFRQTKINILRRVLFYSFLFYAVNVIQLKTGGIVFPTLNEGDTERTLNYVGDWFGIYNTINFNTFYFSSFSLLFNFILFIPFGIYLSIFFNVKSFKKGILLVFLVCFGIEMLQLVLGSLGLVITQGLDTAKIISLNISGGIFGFLLFELMIKFFGPLKYLNKTRA